MPDFDPYAALRANETQSRAPRLSTGDIIAQLERWGERCGFHIEEARRHSVMLRFERLPIDLDNFTREVEAFCPDALRGFGAYAAAVRQVREAGVRLPEDVREIIDGLEIDSDGFNREALKRSLFRERSLLLIWGTP